MRKIGGLLLAIAVTVLLATPSSAAERRHVAARSHAYDGLWTVLIRTNSGPCDPSYRYPARIVGGQLLHADRDLSYEISGVVVSSGAIAVTVNKGIGTATGYGRLHGGSGGGHWSAGGNTCTGVWTAMRRASN
jgi:hypothetical protein